MSASMEQSRSERKAVVAGTVGTVLEWYDYGLYGLGSALIFGPLFFANLPPEMATLASFATFAVGFFARPVGGLVLGGLGDRIGRRAVLILCVVMIGLATVGIGLLPTFDQIGVWAPVLLVTLRIIQGFGAGIEVVASVTLISEGAREDRRGFLTSIAYSGQFIGGLLSSGFLLILSSTMTPEAFLGWGWRIPFLAGLLALIFAIIVRIGVEESPQFVQAQQARRVDKGAIAKKPSALVEAWKYSRRSLLATFLIPSGQLVMTYLIATFAISYLTQIGMSQQFALLYSLLATAALPIIAYPITGKLVDRFGARRIMFIGFAGIIVFSFPFFAMLNTGDPALALAAGIIFNVLISPLLVAPQGKYIPTLFPVSHRLAGFAGAREISAAVFAGPAPFVASALVLATGGQPWLVAVFLIAGALLSLIGMYIARDIDKTNELAPEGAQEASLAPSAARGSNR